LDDGVARGCQGGVSCRELFPRLGFIVTNTQFANRKVVHFYNQRGKAEQWIKEGKQAVKMTRLSATGSGAMRSGCG
jgi:hypothetical protein